MSDDAPSRPMIDPRGQRRRRMAISVAVTIALIVLVVRHLID